MVLQLMAAEEQAIEMSADNARLLLAPSAVKCDRSLLGCNAVQTCTVDNNVSEQNTASVFRVEVLR
jgi:hypothetical protein